MPMPEGSHGASALELQQSSIPGVPVLMYELPVYPTQVWNSIQQKPSAGRSYCCRLRASLQLQRGTWRQLQQKRGPASQQQSGRGWKVSTAGSAAAGTLALGALQYLGRARASLPPWRERCLSLCSSSVCTVATSQRQCSLWGHIPFKKGQCMRMHTLANPGTCTGWVLSPGC